jgi:hypothetical protein
MQAQTAVGDQGMKLVDVTAKAGSKPSEILSQSEIHSFSGSNQLSVCPRQKKSRPELKITNVPQEIHIFFAAELTALGHRSQINAAAMVMSIESPILMLSLDRSIHHVTNLTELSRMDLTLLYTTTSLCESNPFPH